MNTIEQPLSNMDYWGAIECITCIFDPWTACIGYVPRILWDLRAKREWYIDL